MTNIAAYRELLIAKRYPSLREAVTELNREFNIDGHRTAIDRCIGDLDLSALNRDSLEMAYDFLKNLRVAVIKGKNACTRLQVITAAQMMSKLIPENKKISLDNLNEMLSHYIKANTVFKSINAGGEWKNGQPRRIELDNPMCPTKMKISKEGAAHIKTLPGLVPPLRTINSTMLLSEEALSRIKNLKGSTIVVDGKEFQVNKTILSLQSEFFSQLFGQTEFKEGKENHFEIKQEGVTQKAFEAYLTFVYEKKIPKKCSMEILTSLYKLAHFLEDRDLTSALIFKIYKRLDRKCFMEVLQLAVAMNTSGEDKAKEPSFWEKNNQFLLDLVEEYLEMVPDAAIGFDPKGVDVYAKLDLLTVALNRDLLKDDRVREILLEKLIEEPDGTFFEKICALGVADSAVRALCKSYFTRHKDMIDPKSALYESYIAVLLSQTKSSTKKVAEKVGIQKTV